MSFSVSVGAQQQCTYTVRDNFGNPLFGIGSPVWSTSDPTIATVASNGVVTGVGSGFATVTATLGGASGSTAVTVLPQTGAQFVSMFNQLPGMTLLHYSERGVNQTVNADVASPTGFYCARHDDVRGINLPWTPDAGLNSGKGAPCTADGTMWGAGLDITNSTGITGGALFHGDANTLANAAIPNSGGLGAIFSDHSAGLTVGGVGRILNGQRTVVVGEDADANKIELYGDDAGNLQVLHASAVWDDGSGHGANFSGGSPILHFAIHVNSTAEPTAPNDVQGSTFWQWRMYHRDVSFPFDQNANSLASGRRIRMMGDATVSAGRERKANFVGKGFFSGPQRKFACDYWRQQFGIFEDTNNLVLFPWNSYLRVNFDIVADPRKIMEGEAGAPAVANTGMTLMAFSGHRPQCLLYPFTNYLAGCDFSKRPKVVAVASEFLNATPYNVSLSDALTENYFWVKALTALGITVVMHNQTYHSNDPTQQNQQSVNDPAINNDLQLNAVRNGAVGVFDFLRSQWYNPDAQWYGTGSFSRSNLMENGIHPSTLGQELLRRRYELAVRFGLGQDISARAVEVYTTPSYSLTSAGSLTTTPTWTAKNYLGNTVAKTLAFSSVDPTVATVDASTGLITGVGNGTTAIRATADDGAKGFTIVSVTVDEITALRGVITGGDAAILAMYSTNYGITIPGTGFEPNGVSQWDDARGAVSFGPSVLAFGTPSDAYRPEWDAINKVMTFDGSVDFMQTAASSLFDTSGALSLILVGAVQQTGSTGSAAIIASGSFTRLLAIRNSSGAGGTITAVNMNIVEDSTVTVSATRRLIIASKTGTTGVAIDVPNHARVSGTDVTQAVGNNTLSLGAQSGGSLLASMAIRAVIVVNHQLSVGEITALATWAQTYHAAVLA